MELRVARAGPAAVAGALALALGAGPLAAQVPDLAADTAHPMRCSGFPITAVELVSDPPNIGQDRLPDGMASVAQFLVYPWTSGPEAVRPFLLLKEGDVCDPFLMAESERLLRAQYHISDAEITTAPGPEGGLLLQVRTVDEIPTILDGRIRRTRVSGVIFGNRNLFGVGQLASLGWQEGFAYRDGFRARYLNSHVLGQLYRLQVGLVRAPLGGHLQLAFGRPFLTSAQRGAWYVNIDREDGYYRFARPDLDDLSLPLERNRFDAGAVVRVGGRTAGLFGGFFLSHDQIQPGAEAVIVSDSGLVAADDDRLDGRWSDVTSSGAGLVLGLRFLSFRTVRGFQSLMGAEDVGRGVMSTTAIGRSLDESTTVVSTDLYVGVSTERSLLTLEAAWERQGLDADWHDAVASGRISWILKGSDARALSLAAEFAGVWRGRQPFQLRLGWDGGVRGYRGTWLAGDRRLVIRGESRWVLGTVADHIGVGLAAFSDLGTVWAGDAPFGETPAPRPSVGAALLLAAPQDSRRLIRLEVAVPLVPADGAGIDIRISSSLPSSWREPRSVELYRTVAPRISIFEWR